MPTPETSTLVRIRSATAADAGPLAPLALQIFRETFAHLSDPVQMEKYCAQAFEPGQLAREIDDPASRFLLVERGGELVGYAKLRTGYVPKCVTGPEPIELSRMYVRSDCHGRGVAHQLMQACLDECLRMAKKTWWLGVWEYNQRARAFYRKWGFVEVGAHPFQFADELQEDLVMVRGL